MGRLLIRGIVVAELNGRFPGKAQHLLRLLTFVQFVMIDAQSLVRGRSTAKNKMRSYFLSSFSLKFYWQNYRLPIQRNNPFYTLTKSQKEVFTKEKL